MRTYIYVDYLATPVKTDKYIIVCTLYMYNCKYMYVHVYMHACARIISVACDRILTAHCLVCGIHC